jgi:hypothetical protein
MTTELYIYIYKNQPIVYFDGGGEKSTVPWSPQALIRRWG